jgi:hypothetical protein
MDGKKIYTVNRMEAQPSVKLVNRLMDLGKKLGLRIWELDRDSILERARRKTGLTYLGNEKYIEVLDRLIDNARKAEITPLGMYAINFLALKTTINRLHIEEYIRRHPEVENIPIESPVFVVGFPRTGTTLLQNVLSLGPGYRALFLWERNTVPPA